MPTIHPQQAGGSSSNGDTSQRAPFRPPWIKDGPNPLPMPAAPWTLARARDRRTSKDEPAQAPEPTPVRKQSKITIIPSQPNAENGISEARLKQDVISAAASKQRPEQPAELKIDIQTASKQTPPKEKKIDIQIQSKQTPKENAAAAPKEKKIDIQVQSKQTPVPTPKKEEASKQQSAPQERQVAVKQSEPVKERKVEVQRKPSIEPPTEIQRKPSRDFIPPKPPAPPMPPPPLPGLTPISKDQAVKIEALRSRPRKRPDWGAMMKEVESGKKLRHIDCNDRSAPLLPGIKVKETFMYESEKPNVHNLLLQAIQGGVNLKSVKCNDRSKPILDGLRKFRRQLTIEEQMQKSEVAPVGTEPDELDDIDKVRDDLQSTKQMLALELRNKEAVERENKRLLARLLNMEVEIEKERLAKQQTTAPSAQEKKSDEEKVLGKMKEELNVAQKQTQELENKFHETASQLDMARSDLEEARRKNAALERRLAGGMGRDQPLMKQPSAKKLASMTNINAAAGTDNAMMQPPEDEDEESEYEYETETEEEEDSSEDEEKAAALREKRTARELKLLNTKVYSLKEKEDIARKERRALRQQLKNQQRALRNENKKYKVLQKEVDKMSNLMNDEDEEAEEDEEEEEEEEESEESSSEESEEEESDGDLPSEAPVEQRKKNYMDRAKKHENILAVLRKGNYLLKANVDKLKDDLFKQKEMALTLQEDLNSVLAELGWTMQYEKDKDNNPKLFIQDSLYRWIFLNQKHPLVLHFFTSFFYKTIKTNDQEEV